MSVRMSRAELALYADELVDFVEGWKSKNLEYMDPADAYNLGAMAQALQNLVDGING